MSFGEIIRALESYTRKEKNRQKETASFNYIMANLIGRSVMRIYDSNTTYPEINEVYPKLFDSEELEEAKEKRDIKISELRFTQFAAKHNAKYNKEVEVNK